MAVLADAHDLLFLHIHNRGIAAGDVRGMAVYTGAGLWIGGLPSWKEGVKVPVEVLSLRGHRMALQAVAVTDGNGQRGGLASISTAIGQQIASADGHPAQPPQHAAPGVAVNTARGLPGVPRSQINRRIGVTAVKVSAFRLCVT